MGWYEILSMIGSVCSIISIILTILFWVWSFNIFKNNFAFKRKINKLGKKKNAFCELQAFLNTLSNEELLALKKQLKLKKFKDTTIWAIINMTINQKQIINRS